MTCDIIVPTVNNSFSKIFRVLTIKINRGKDMLRRDFDNLYKLLLPALTGLRSRIIINLYNKKKKFLSSSDLLISKPKIWNYNFHRHFYYKWIIFWPEFPLSIFGSVSSEKVRCEERAFAADPQKLFILGFNCTGYPNCSKFLLELLWGSLDSH